MRERSARKNIYRRDAEDAEKGNGKTTATAARFDETEPAATNTDANSSSNSKGNSSAKEPAGRRRYERRRNRRDVLGNCGADRQVARWRSHVKQRLRQPRPRGYVDVRASWGAALRFGNAESQDESRCSAALRSRAAGSQDESRCSAALRSRAAGSQDESRCSAALRSRAAGSQDESRCSAIRKQRPYRPTQKFRITAARGWRLELWQRARPQAVLG